LGGIAHAQVTPTINKQTPIASGKTASPHDSARQLMTQARIAFDKGDLNKSRLLAEQAKATKASQQFWDESPDQLLAEIDRKQGKTSTVKKTSPSNDPVKLIAVGRTALNDGRLDEAQDLARQAEAQSRGTRWGLFDDTPASLLGDVQKAKAKKDRTEADRLLVEARKLYDKPTQSPAERIDNLDKAQAMAYRADKLHGSYSMWDLGDRPTRLIGEIESNRAKLRMSRTDTAIVKNQPLQVPKVDPKVQPKIEPMNPIKTVSNPMPMTVPMVQSPLAINNPPMTNNGTPSLMLPDNVPSNPMQPVVGVPVAPALTADQIKAKTIAKNLMAESQSLMVAGKMKEGKAKLVQAQQLRAPFGADEQGPDEMLQMLVAAGHQQIQKLIQEASVAVNKATPDQALAIAHLNAAMELATGLGLDPQPIIQARTAWKIPSTVTPPVANVTPMQPTPMQNPGVVNVSTNLTPNQGQEMLNAARMELRRGDTEMAKRITIDAMSGPFGVQNDGQALLRTIEAEEYTQRRASSVRSYGAAMTAYQNRNFRESLGILKQIDPTMLPIEKQSQYKEIVSNATREIELASRPANVPGQAVVKTNPAPSGVVQTSQLQPTPQLGNVSPAVAQGQPMGVIQTQPMTQLPNKLGPNNLAQQVQALQEVQFQALRTEGLQVQSEATKKFGRGETDAAVESLRVYLGKVKESQIDPNRIALLSRPVEYRLENFKLLKRQKDFYTKESNDLKDTRTRMTAQALNDQNRKEETAKLMKDFHALLDQGKYREAQMTAMKAHDLDPDDPATQAAIQIAKVQANQAIATRNRENSEDMFIRALGDAEDQGPHVDAKNPVVVDAETMRRTRGREAFREGYTLRNFNDREKMIELKLNKPVTVDFKNAPLDQVIDDLRVMSGMNIVADRAALEEANIPINKLVSLKVDNLSMKNVMNILLKQVHLTHVIEDDVLKITTEKHAKGKLIQRVFSVADLVIPIDNYAIPESQNLAKIFENQNAARAVFGNNTPQMQSQSPFGLPQGQGVAPGNGNLQNMPQGGNMINNMQNNQSTPSPMAPSGFVVRNKNTMEDRLMKLVTSTIKPLSWSDVGGSGTIDYYPIGLALVVNQTADVIQEVSDLLEALRRLQDLEVSVEVRLITLSESFFERIGLDFALNITTDNTSLEPQLTTQQFAPAPYINNLQTQGNTVGLTPARTFTSDLNVPIRSSSFQYAIPPFGGYPNNPGFDGGLSLGLAFLNDIQVFMFMEAAQGDRRMNVMQAPKLTLFNGQTATIQVQDQQFFVANVQVFAVNGQIVFVPQNTPIPTQGVTVTVQAVVSADRRFVRLNLIPFLTNLQSTVVPLFPITTFVTPVFEGGSQGQPIPFTQFIQQPAFQTITIQTTVAVPDGGTVLLGGLKTLSEGRNEFGPPVLSKIPYVNRLFKNVGYGRETQSLMLMVTPRIIINTEEETRQTGLDPAAENQR